MEEVVFMFQVKRKERGLVSLEAWVDEGVLDIGEEEEKESLFSMPGSPWVPFSILSAVLNMGLQWRTMREERHKQENEGEHEEDKEMITDRRSLVDSSCN